MNHNQIEKICGTCHHWEPKDDPTLANGYCPTFNKTTNEGDGERCTAWERIHLEKTPTQPDGGDEP